MFRTAVMGCFAALACASGGAQAASRPSPPSPIRIVCASCRSTPPALALGRFPPRATLLGQHRGNIEPVITRQAGGKPYVLQTPGVTLVAMPGGGLVEQMLADEVAYLRIVFPRLGPAPAALDPHQRAHLLAYRVHKVEQDVHRILDLDAGGGVRAESGPHRQAPGNPVEIFVFAAKPGFDAFTAFAFDGVAWPAGGALLKSGPASAILLESLNEPAARRALAFSAAMQLLRRLSRDGPGLQPWLRVGLAHVVEDRHALAGSRPEPGATLPPGAAPPRDRDRHVADLVAAGNVADLATLAATPEGALGTDARLQARSVVAWMLAQDAGAFAALVRALLHAPPDVAPGRALHDAAQSAFHRDPGGVLDAWKAWVRENRPGN